MSRVSLLAMAVLLGGSCVVRAHVTSNLSCTNCHDPSSGRASILAPFTTNAIDDPGVTIGLPKFKVAPGALVNLVVSITNGGQNGDSFASVLSGFSTATTDAGALNSSNTLTFTPDATWNARTSGGFGATQGPLSWGGTTTNRTYAMTVSASSAPDYYLLTLGATGFDSGSNLMWTSLPSSFYLQVAPTPEPAALAVVALCPLLLARRRRNAR